MNLKKLKITKNLKIGLIVTGIVMTGILTVFGIKAFKTPIITEEQKKIYEYSNGVEVHYNVAMKPNQLYREKVLPENQFYLSGFVKDIAIQFNVTFNSDVDADVKGTYEVSTALQGYDMKEEEKIVVWHRPEGEPIKGDFKTTGNKDVVTKEITIPFEQYNHFTTAIIEEAKAYTQAEIVVKLVGKKSITIQGETKEVPIDTTVYIPLVESYFCISTEGVEEGQEVGTKIITNKFPPDKKLAAQYGIGACIGLLMTLGVVFLTTKLTREDTILKNRKRLFKEYGSRMVGIEHIEENSNLEVHQVSKLDDLIKIADELQKPVFYINHRNILDIRAFYIKEQNNLYTYKIKQEIIPNIHQEESQERDKPQEIEI